MKQENKKNILNLNLNTKNPQMQQRLLNQFRSQAQDIPQAFEF